MPEKKMSVFALYWINMVVKKGFAKKLVNYPRYKQTRNNVI